MSHQVASTLIDKLEKTETAARAMLAALQAIQANEDMWNDTPSELWDGLENAIAQAEAAGIKVAP